MEETRNSPFLNSQDRISNLPEDIIDRIMSFFEMKEVVQTSLLSRRWKDMWTSVSTLHFDTRAFMSSEAKESIHYREEKFDLCWDNKSNDIAENLDTWIIIALKHSVQRLTIEIEYNEDVTFRLPRRLFKFSSLTSLVLDFNGSRVVLPDSMCLPRLEYLDLRKIRIDDVKLLNKLLSSCPVLEDLILKDIVANNEDGVSVDIKSSQLKHLKMVNNYRTACNMAKIIKLTTQGLKSFICSDYMKLKYSLGNLSSLVTASIDMAATHEIEEDLYPERMIKFLLAVRSVEELTLLSDVVQVWLFIPLNYFV
ncbi:putative F-box/LRR-repeat protein At3g44810 [Papaver somniferum]|uniref:putative F-box/LRR-repeat protein At3g44810 n=1 Tax=Papaver somniferum TaxID=3469 RepID=UPI000E6FDF35|nr:putative F-box/LRR-repeat protein At3g44810 [Papaver somniferum]